MSSPSELDLEIEKPTDPASLMVELIDLRRRMVRDLEQFLSVELSAPATWVRLAPRLIQFARSEYQPCC